MGEVFKIIKAVFRISEQCLRMVVPIMDNKNKLRLYFLKINLVVRLILIKIPYYRLKCNLFLDYFFLL